MENKVVWITGASSGIGESLVKAYAKRGAMIVLSSRRTEELKKIARSTGLDENRYMILPLDVSNPDQLQGCVDEVVNRFGRVDYLFNNAGISTRAMAMESPLEIDRKVMEVNYFGAVALTKAILPQMVRQGSGHIILTSSVTGKTGTSSRSAYAASKHALHGFFDSLRVELDGSGISVTILCPGYIRTQISINALTATGEKFNKMNSNQEQGMDPDRLAEKIVKAVAKKKREVAFGGKEILGIYLKRFFPGFLHRVLVKQHRSNNALR